MRTLAATFTLATAVANISPAQGTQAVLSSPDLLWTNDIPAVMSDARASGSPAIVYVQSRVARACGELEQQTMRDPKVVEQMKDFKLAYVDVTEDTSRLASLQVIRVPTVIFYAPDGRELFRAVGYKTPSDFLGYLTAIERPKRAGGSGSGGSAARPGAATTSTAPSTVSMTYDPGTMVLHQRPGTRKQTLKIYEPSALTVSVMGEFNDWRNDTLPLTRHESGWWWVDLHLSDGLYHYVYNVDSQKKRDPVAEYRKFIKEIDAYASTLVVGTMPGPRVDAGGATTFTYYDRNAKQVYFVWGHNNYEPIPMFTRGDGFWGLQYTLPAGDYEYWFQVDGGNWTEDQKNPVGSERGGSLLTIKPEQIALR
ncbi:MAG: hypothetical protein SF028_11050 [Candidatus Sumerlaeia bacterium]|nr:hypothetical protein [Candidatus Sumerlaeia bacterium]